MKTTQAEIDAYMDALKPKLRAKGLTVQEYAWVGSTYINGEGNDIDIIVHVHVEPDSPGIHGIYWSDLGLVFGGSEPHGSDDTWLSTKDVYGTNVIFITDLSYYDKWVAAAEACKYVQELLDSNSYLPLGKEERVKLHRIIMDGEDA